MKVYPVIHVSGVQSTLADVARVVGQPIAGVFLIDHDVDDSRLAKSVAAVADAYPDLFLGANFIGRSLSEAVAVMQQFLGTAAPLSAVWSDSAGLDAVLYDSTAVPDARPSGWHGLYFGGVAFKYQAPVAVSDLPRLGATARRYVDVATTSGPGTGMSADLARLRALRVGLGDHPLALASGVTPQNVFQYVGLVDHVLVASGISGPDGRADEGLLNLLLTNVERDRPNGAAGAGEI